MNIQVITSLFIALSFSLVSCNDHQDNHADVETIYDQTPVKVYTQKVGFEDTASSAVLSGTIQSSDQSTISARLMGYVSKLNVDVGDQVSAGQTILTIKNNELPAKKAQAQAGIMEAEAGLNNIKLNYDRLKTLWEQESITRKEWDDISSQYQMMKAKVEGAKQVYNEINEFSALTIVKAPISGVISSKMINQGDLVNPGVPLLEVEGGKSYEVVSYVADYQISQVKKGMELDCQINAIDKIVKAKLTEISPSAVNTGGQFMIKADLLLNREERAEVFPGMYANILAALPTNTEKSSCTTIEKSALIQRGQLTGIYTVSTQNTALLRWIRIGKDLGDRVEVVSGLKSGEEYIVSNLSDLSDGMPITK